MGDLITIGGVHRKVDGYYVVVNGVYRKVQLIFEVVNGVYRKAYIAFDPHSIPLPISGWGSINYPYQGDWRTLTYIPSELLQKARSALGANCKIHISGTFYFTCSDGSGEFGNTFYCGGSAVASYSRPDYDLDGHYFSFSGDYAFDENNNFNFGWSVPWSRYTSAQLTASASVNATEAYFTV